MLDLLRATAVVLLLSATGCSVPASIHAAEEGRLANLDKAVAGELARGDFDTADAPKLAQAVLRYEIERAEGAAGAARVLSMESCARRLDDALAQRTQKGGEVGAAAAMVRLEAGLAEPKDFAPWVNTPPAEPRAAYRAVGARALILPEESAARRALIVDGDQTVRLAALRAATDAAYAGDVEAVLEAARVDPYPLARTQAIRAAGAIGGERVVLALKDLWALADEPAREAIADAWGSARSLVAGGRRELLWAAETQRGAAAVAAASALMRAPKGEGQSEAIGVLSRAIEGGAWREQVYAITVADLSIPVLRAAVSKATASSDDIVTWTAMRKPVETSAERGGARGTERAKWVDKLMKLASAGTTTQALVAQGGLSRAGEKRVIPLLDKTAKAADARARLVAGTAFATLGELGRAAVLAGDKDAGVRTAVSCAILRAAARR